MAASTHNKRKRDVHDAPGGRSAPALAASTSDFDTSYLETGDDSLNNNDGVMDFSALDSSGDHSAGAGGQSNADTAAAAIAQYHTMTVPQSTEQAFMQGAEGGADRTPGDAAGSNGSGQRRVPTFADFVAGGDAESQDDEESPSRRDNMTQIIGRGSKPSVGSEEWHKQRRDNHKEVERRRREAINEGISELSKIVPGCEKNKGSILQRAVQFITQLKDNESQNIEKWTLEKLLTEQAIAELSSSCDKLKAECQRAWTECEVWKKAGAKAGVTVDPADLAAAMSGAGVGADGKDADGEEAE